jgi:hypothetical protein
LWVYRLRFEDGTFRMQVRMDGIWGSLPGYFSASWKELKLVFVVVFCCYCEYTHVTGCVGRAMAQARLVAGLSPRRPGFDPGSVHMGFVVDKVALGQVFPRVLRFSLSISFHRCCIKLEKRKKKSSSSQGCTRSLEGCDAPVASAAGPFTTKKLCLYLFMCT